jgi:hypothetical protein
LTTQPRCLYQNDLRHPQHSGSSTGVRRNLSTAMLLGC